jgi:hypothetical protein
MRRFVKVLSRSTVTDRNPEPMNELVDAVVILVLVLVLHGAPFEAALRTRIRGRSGFE